MKQNFLFTTTSYWIRINSLQSYVRSLTPITNQEDTKQLEIFANKIGDNFNLSKDENNELLETLQTLYKKIETGEKNMHDYREEFESSINELNEIAMGNKEAALVINKAIDDALFSSSIRYSDILRSNTIISLVSFFELLVAELLHTFFIMKPLALSSDEKEFSINDIKKFNDIDDFFESLRIKKVDGFLRNSLDTWRKFFLKNLKLDLQTIANDWDAFNEVIQRRNIIVHNDGKVSKQYIAKVRSSYSDIDEIFEGKQLIVSEDYLINSIGQVLLFGLKLIYLTWIKLIPEEEGIRNAVFEKISYQLLVKGEWGIAADLLSFINQYTNSQNLVSRFNYWLCMKKLGSLEMVLDEINGVLTTGFTPAFELCYYGLMDNTEGFYGILPNALKEGITKENILSWPIFEEIRKDNNFFKAVSIY